MPHETTKTFTPTFYEVLGLSTHIGDVEKISSQMIKSAYRRSLLIHHPDKASAIQPGAEKSASRGNIAFSIDQITEAYNVLSISKQRAQYDLELRLHSSAHQEGERKQTFKTGIEVVDLDDLAYDEAENVWYRNCRCGDDRGFLIREVDLEEVADEGELGVGCRGCSLWLKVLFGVADEDDVINSSQELGKDGG